MRKAILISINPEWAQKILCGEKTVEIRKTAPKCDLPIDVYIYVTKPKHRYTIGGTDYETGEYSRYYNGCTDELYKLPDGTIKFGDSCELMLYENYSSDNFLNGKVVARFTLKEVEKVKYFADWTEMSCLTEDDLYGYSNKGKAQLYAWHISELQIFDKPMQLSNFCVECGDYAKDGAECGYCLNYDGDGGCRESGMLSITRSPQSWQYVWVEE